MCAFERQGTIRLVRNGQRECPLRLPKLVLLVATAALVATAGVLAARHSPHPLFLGFKPSLSWSSSELDGVYFLASIWGDRPLEIRGSFVQWPSAFWGNSPGTLGREDGVLMFQSSNKSERATYAVIDGTLWVGVMRRDRDTPTRWYLLNELTGGSGGDGPSVASWDEATQRWTHSLRGEGETASAGVKSDHGFWPDPSHPDAGAAERRGYWNPAWCLENANPCEHLRLGAALLERHGDVLLTPWSKSLGRVGLISQPGLSGAVLGRWSPDGEVGPEMVEFVTGPPPREVPLMASDVPPMPRSEPKRVEVPRGASVFMLRWGQGHMIDSHSDTPATTIYVILSEERILKRVRLGGCPGAGQRLRDVFLQPVRD